MKVSFGKAYTDENGKRMVPINWVLEEGNEPKLRKMMMEIGTDDPDVVLQWVANAIVRDPMLFKGKSSQI